MQSVYDMLTEVTELVIADRDKAKHSIDECIHNNKHLPHLGDVSVRNTMHFMFNYGVLHMYYYTVLSVL